MINLRIVCSLEPYFMLRDVKYLIILMTLLIILYHFFLYEVPLLSTTSTYDFYDNSLLSDNSYSFLYF